MDKLLIDTSLELAFEKLKNFLKTETVIGEPITVGEVTLIPIVTVSFGCSGGAGQGTDAKGSEGGGGGLGVGAKISPDAVLVIKNGEVSLLQLKQKQNLDKLLNMVPELITKININKSENKNSDESVSKTEE
ncbi:GerW family sporulation protein [Lutispora thermophila]|uniref:Uncharacterized spore protein YtfJ n=1 Tax=Lutispora thermophila DSM 19022 TaxID=1122184 RepID=A0A1M6CIG9_9FIRM|nr:spore germination protein GerW family protein [Lutispora thermophila]SHI60822.1 Uncharacterized spore protein YtfJ [Lutispora thermophila DSM 19022]